MTLKREPVLIANRGEIAVRIARTCRALGFPVVAVYSDADKFSEHVRHSDQAYWVGSAAPKESYLNIERIIAAAKASGTKYIHPGYGFLSERPQFARAVREAGMIFVGPTPESMEMMGDKVTARATVDKLGIPRPPGSAGVVKDAAEAATIAKKVGYPVLLKASAGGGGKGMRKVSGEAEITGAFEGASREAQAAFGDGSMYVEKLILEPHHVEIQVFGDGKGRAIHLGDRECSIQRRHQKVWEESPAPVLNRFPRTREAMFEAAVRIAEHVNYAGAGTLEFVVDGQGNFYFLEMNTRLQVEHPVTEWVTGVDLVAWQLLLAAGEFTLPAVPECRGAAIEARLYAEDPKNFLPAPGKLGLVELPNGAFVRTDSGIAGTDEVTPHYDPMIAKISVWGQTRAEAVGRMRVAVDEARVEPPRRRDGSRVGSMRTNLSFLRRLVRHQAVIEGETTTDLIARFPELTGPDSTEPSLEAALAVALFQMLQESEQSVTMVQTPTAEVHSHWKLLARKEGVRQ